MRPRSRLLAKKRLPTIREGNEELLQDMNQANSCHAPRDGLSSEDYLLSIRQLARPAFPLREQDRDILTLGQLEALKPSLRLPRLPPPTRPPTPAARGCVGPREEDERKERAESRAPSTVATATRAAPDPLEYLYGCRDAPTPPTREMEGRLSEGGARLGPRPLPRSQSFPRLCSPRHAHRKGSCPEIRLADAPLGEEPMGGSPERKPSVVALPAQGEQEETTGRGAPAGERKNCSGPVDRHSMISSWIADCRSAWHEARMRACLLPTIAEI